MIKSLVSPLAWLLLLVIVRALLGLRRPRRGLDSLLLAAGIVVWLLSTPYVSTRLGAAIELQSPAVARDAPAAVIVLAGGSFRGPDGRAYLSHSTMARVVRGVEAMRDSGARSMIMTGRANQGGFDSEVMAMRDLAVHLGVSPDKIGLEPRARNTFEHPGRILDAKLARQQDRVIVVTDPTHTRRAVGEFRRYFRSVTPVSTHPLLRTPASALLSWIPEAEALQDSTFVVREWFGILWYDFRHWREH